VNARAAWDSYLTEILRPVETSTPVGVRQAHVVSDPVSRTAKAQAIASVLESVTHLDGMTIVDDGCGSGYIAAHLAGMVGATGRVIGVDQVDERQVLAGYEFHLLNGSRLPLDDGSVDVVVSNHVLEHVGGREEQRMYLDEIHRVLKPGGWLYLAVPNKFRLMEAHYGLPVLSWLPQRTADRLVRRTGKGEWYDVTPLSRPALHSLVRQAGFQLTDMTAKVARRELSQLPGRAGQLAELPAAVLNPALQIVPTFVLLGRRV
jgi:SAM-dependent methyltransferase